MKIVWDEPKRIANFQKHGLDFADVVDFEWETAVIDDTRSSRMKAIGYFAAGTAVVILPRLKQSPSSVSDVPPPGKKSSHGH